MNSELEMRIHGTNVATSTKVDERDGCETGGVNEYIRYVPSLKIISDFVVACENGDVEMVKFWWDKNPSILRVVLNDMCYDEDLFYIICERGHIQLAKWMININPDFVSDIMHEDLMTDVCLAGKVSVAKWLLKICPHFREQVLEDEHPNLFRRVCKLGHLNMAKWLVNVNPKIIEIKENLVYPFWKSSANGKLNIAKWLYSISSEVVYSLNTDTELDTFKESMLLNLCSNGNLVVVKWLLTILPPINNKPFIEDIFYESCRTGHLNIAKCIFNAYPDTENYHFDDHTFHVTCGKGHSNIAKWLLKIKPGIDIRSNSDFAFHNACINGNLYIAKWLLHICPQIYNNLRSDSTFAETCLLGQLDVVKWLFDIKYTSIDSSLNIDDVINSKKANTDVVKWLFEVIPRLYSFDRRSNLVRAVELSCLTGDLELVKIIFEKQEEYISENIDPSRVFATVCCNGNLELINWLLTKFSDLDISSNDELPFINACTNGHFMLVKRLLEIKPDINISANGDKAFKNACENGHVEVFRWLENMFPEKYSVGQPRYIGNDGLGYDSDEASEDDEDEDEDEDEENGEIYLNNDGVIETNYTYSYTIFKFISITKNILKQDIPKQLDDCSICLDSQSNVYTSCSHMYCKPCISKWLKTHDTCPCCRVELEDENMSNIIFE